MSESKELRLKIDAYTAETMPLDRLVAYLRELAVVLGDPQRLHLMRVETGSTTPVLRVDEESLERVRQRARDLRRGAAPRDAVVSYGNINRMLREDKTKATLIETGEEVDGAEIIPFPGVYERKPTIAGIQQQGTLDGLLQRIGGSQPWVPIQLRTLDAQTITHCLVRRRLAKEMGTHLFEPLRLYGRGRWTRTDLGWRMDSFHVESFETLSEDALPTVVSALRAVPADWGEDPIGNIRKLREDEGGE